MASILVRRLVDVCGVGAETTVKVVRTTQLEAGLLGVNSRQRILQTSTLLNKNPDDLTGEVSILTSFFFRFNKALVSLFSSGGDFSQMCLKLGVSRVTDQVFMESKCQVHP